jgi:hypothetical protein
MAHETALWLRGVDPLSADPGEISVVLELPPGLEVLPGGVKLALSAERPGHGSVSGAWTLDASRDPGARWVFRVAEEDRAELSAVQSRAQSWEEVDPEGTSGSLTLAVGGCRTVPVERLDGARASAFLRLSPEKPSRALFRDAPIADLLTTEDIAALPVCT